MPKEFRGENREMSFDELVHRMDMGTKELRDGKLYLAQELNTVFGKVEFQINGTKIVGPDGTEFDLRGIKYNGEKGIYKYLETCQKSEVPRSDSRHDGLGELN